MRGTVDGLGTPHPLGLALPAMLQDDDFAQRFVTGLDPLLATVVSTLDCLEAYFDADLAPADFLAWLGRWLGVELDETWPIERRRELVRSMAELYGRRGTVTGLRELLRIYTGVEPEISDSGAVAWAPIPGAPLPGRAETYLLVRIAVDPDTANLVDKLIAANVPAHVPYTLEVVEE